MLNTKARRPFVSPEIRDRLYEHICAIGYDREHDLD